MPENPEKTLHDPGYGCEGLPDHSISNLEIVTYFRGRVGDAVVNEQMAVLGADRVMQSMQRAHRAHLVASSLTEKQLHQRAEMLESVMIEFGVPDIGVDRDVLTDVDRIQMFIRVVQGMADIAAEAALQAEAELHITYESEESDAAR